MSEAFSARSTKGRDFSERERLLAMIERRNNKPVRSQKSNSRGGEVFTDA